MEKPLSSKWTKSNQVAVLETQEDYCRIAIPRESDEFLREKIKAEMGIIPFELEERPLTEIQRFQQRTQRQLDILEVEPSAEKSWESEPIINLVDSLLEQALERKASDIHLEPCGKDFRIRFRQDGLLEDFKILPLWICEPVLVRIKVLADIDITDKRIPHDGSFTYSNVTQKISVRVSTLPVISDNQQIEKCVLRILPSQDDTGTTKGLQSLHFSKAVTEHLQEIFRNPQGLFLVTGPTGSGKTTTLHAGLQEIVSKPINIVTIEDPVEYVLPGTNQVQVNEKWGFTFAQALRSILRQDPDVILVGEIRDTETAQIALRAAQTGHLVLSTLHTNDAKSAYNRLQDLGIPLSILRESLLGIMAQRLARKENTSAESPGRYAIVELLRPDGSFVDGTLKESARRLVQQGAIHQEEATRVLGRLYYIKDDESF